MRTTKASLQAYGGWHEPRRVHAYHAPYVVHGVESYTNDHQTTKNHLSQMAS